MKYQIDSMQKQIRLDWLNKKLPKTNNPIEIFKRNEFKIYSQSGEDGIINYIFSKIKTTNKTFVEFGIEDGRECNSANLVKNFGWNGLFMEGDRMYAMQAKEYYRNYPVRVLNSFITAENINQIISSNGINGEIDLLSVDIDGNDYWVWSAINCINPRVVITEYNSSLGKEAITIRYNPRFQRLTKDKTGLYYGASLSAMTKLAQKKGYTLVGVCSSGINAFFIRKDIAKKYKFKEIKSEEISYPNIGRTKKFGSVKEQFKKIEHLEFTKV
jgi:hypothetical protein